MSKLNPLIQVEEIVWHHVDLAMPDDDIEVLIFTGYGEDRKVAFGYHSCEYECDDDDVLDPIDESCTPSYVGWYFSVDNSHVGYMEVTHWAELPEGPKQ